MEEPTEEQEAQPKPTGGKGGLDLTKILLIVLIVAVLLVGGAILMRGCGSGKGAASKGGSEAGDGKAEAPAKTKLSLIALPSNTSTNRLGQVIMWEITIKVRDDENQTVGKEWSSEDKKKQLTSKVIDVLQDIDVSQVRPTPLDRFKSTLQKRLDEVFGEENAVEEIMVSKWVAPPQ